MKSYKYSVKLSIFLNKKEKIILTINIYYANIYIVVRHGEVVELVYGTSLENWRRFVAYRGFESHPLRHFFIYMKIRRITQVVEGDGLLNR